jgi:hypothetical protein
MSGHAAASSRPTCTTDVPGDQPAGAAAASALSLSTTAWHSVLVTNLVTSRRRHAVSAVPLGTSRPCSTVPF